MTISFALQPASPRSDRIRWITRKGDPSGPAIVAGSQIMKTRSKLLRALAFLALNLLLLPVIWLLADALIGGAN